MFSRLGKRKKLALLGAGGFAVVLVLILFSAGFFNRLLPAYCSGENCPQIPDSAFELQPLVIENSSISPEEIILFNEKILAFTVINKDGEFHKLLLLKAAGDGYESVELVFVEPGVETGIPGFFSNIAGFENEKHTVSHFDDGGLVTGSFLVVRAASSNLISCTTCTGENSQVRITLKE